MTWREKRDIWKEKRKILKRKKYLKRRTKEFKRKIFKKIKEKGKIGREKNWRKKI